MKTVNIIRAARDIKEHEAALKWLREFGDNLKDRKNATIRISLHYGGACPGAQEATKVLEAYLAYALADVVKTAMISCENTIDMCRDTIASELEDRSND